MVTILLGGAAAGISVALALTNNGAGIHFMYIPFAFLFVFIFILVRKTQVKLTGSQYLFSFNNAKHVWQLKFNSEVKRYLEQENYNKFFPRGVQFILKEATQLYYTGRRGHTVFTPVIEVLICANPIQAPPPQQDVAINMQYPQQYGYQQQQLPVAVPVYQQNLYQQPQAQPVVYQQQMQYPTESENRPLVYQQTTPYEKQ